MKYRSVVFNCTTGIYTAVQANGDVVKLHKHQADAIIKDVTDDLAKAKKESGL